MKACRELRFLLRRVLSVLTIVLQKSETFTVHLCITYNQYMHHRETETGYHAALCADKRSSLCKRRRVLKMPSPHMPGNWSVDPCGCPRRLRACSTFCSCVRVGLGQMHFGLWWMHAFYELLPNVLHSWSAIERVFWARVLTHTYTKHVTCKSWCLNNRPYCMQTGWWVAAALLFECAWHSEKYIKLQHWHLPVSCLFAGLFSWLWNWLIVTCQPFFEAAATFMPLFGSPAGKSTGAMFLDNFAFAWFAIANCWMHLTKGRGETRET